ncbi:histidine triad nucleotide-binding protein [bacterium]|nr:histidine triad nucleotide-binding protein [bacterium]
MDAPKRARECLFCKIIDGSLPSQKVLETPRVLAFRDISPQAPEHVLIVPKTHVSNLGEVRPEHGAVFQEVFEAAQQVVAKLGLSEKGYRTVFNTGAHACQTVFHLHLHLLGGAQMGGSMVG